MMCVEPNTWVLMSDNNNSGAFTFIVSGPSCSGKDTLLKALLVKRPELAKPVTTTTRPPRPEEIDGVHYNFLNEGEFLNAVQEGEFIEHARVHGKFLYGMTWRSVDMVRDNGRLPVCVLDVQGKATVSAAMPVLSVFITAPEVQLEGRMRRVRPAEEIPLRLQSMRREIAFQGEFDKVIENLDGKAGAAADELVAFYDTCVREQLLAFSGKSQGKPQRTGVKRLGRR